MSDLYRNLDFWDDKYTRDKHYLRDNYTEVLRHAYHDDSQLHRDVLHGIGLDGQVLDIRRVGHNLRVLEIGCGFGSFGAHIARYAQSYTGIDISSIAISRGINAAKESHIHNMHFMQANDGNFALLSDQSFDLIFSTAVFIHTPTDIARFYIVKTSEWLKPDGLPLSTLHLIEGPVVGDGYLRYICGTKV